MNANFTAILLMSSSLTFAQPAQAQAETNRAESDTGIGEIVVTAQRTSQSVLDVPLSIQATSGDQLAASGIRQMSELQLTTPGFVPSNASGYNQMFIRGVGNSIFVGADPSVATFIDDVPRVFGTLVNNFVDVERVEVIKGAPGGLYGRNATGGAVNVITRRPSTDAVAGAFSVSLAEKDTFQASGFVNLPIGSHAAWMLSAERRSHDPYVVNTATGRATYKASMFPGGAPFLGLDAVQAAAFLNSGLSPQAGYNREDFWAVSSKVLIAPSDDLRVVFAADYSRKDDDNGNGGFNISSAATAASVAGFLNLFTGATPQFPADFIASPDRKFAVAQGAGGYVDLEDYGASMTVSLSLDGLDLTSITAYRENRSDFVGDIGFASVPLVVTHVDLRKKAFYQELRAVSTGEGPLHYVAGASFLRTQFDGVTNLSILPPIMVEAPTSESGYRVRNWSAYAQLGYDITDRLNATVSGRYLHEKNDARFALPPNAPYSQTEKKFLPSVTLSYKLADGGNVYLRWARGFKAGGVNPLASPALFPDARTQGGTFTGEEVDSFEAGVRTPLFDRRVQVTAAAFYNDYRNVQFGLRARPNFPQIPIAMVNAGDARTFGAEASITARVSSAVTLGAAAGYLDAKYRRFGIAPGNPVLEPIDLSGARMINSPEWQLSFSADLDQPLSDRIRLVGHAVASHTASTIWNYRGAAFLPDAVAPAYWLVNARLGLRLGGERFELALFGKNLFNEAYTVYGSSSASSGSVLVWGEPRIIGLEGVLRF